MDSHTSESIRDSPPLAPPSSTQPSQAWTLDNYPIVDGKYYNLATDRIEVHTGILKGGPPSVSVYWHNRGGSSNSNGTRYDQFYAVSSLSKCKVTEYLVRIGEILKKEKCTVSSLNATEYAVNVVVVTELSTVDFTALLRDHGLLASSS